MKICCITCTGDRPEMLLRSRVYFERSILPPMSQAEWLVVDDGQNAFNPGGCRYLRRAPDGPNSLGRNLLHAMTRIGAADFVLFWEDDDWYSSDRIAAQVQALLDTAIHGWCRTVYYNIRQRCHYQHANTDHASLFETGMRSDLVNEAIRIIQAHVDKPFIDIELWRELYDVGRLEPFTGKCVGIKGGPGRGGLGSGHKPHRRYRSDEDGVHLRELIGEVDAEWYEHLIQQQGAGVGHD